MINKIDEFKNRLNRALSTRDVKPVQLAAQTGISESTISQYRSGYAKPKADKLSRIADALDVNPAWLMGLDVPMEIDIEGLIHPNEYGIIRMDYDNGRHYIGLSPIEEQIVKHYRTADDKTKAMVKMMLEITEAPTHPVEASHVGRYAARRHTNTSKKLTKRRNGK